MNESRRTESEKFRVLSCLAMVAVVVGHSRPETLMGQIVGKFTLFAVPLFFTVSGFYFIKSLEKYDRMALIKKKVKTLLVPYLCWCLLGWMVFRPGWGEMGMLELVQKVFGFAATYPIGNLPLWYVRALIVFVVVGCVVNPSKRRWWWLHSGAFVGILFAISQCIGYGVAPWSSVAFFSMGCFLAYSRADLNAGSSAARLMIGVFTFLLYVVFVLLAYPSGLVGFGIHCCALVSFWLLCDYIAIPRFFELMMPYSAMIYFMHGAVVFNLDGLILPQIPVEKTELFLDCYFISKILILLSVFSAISGGMKKMTPRLYAVLSGGR